MKYDIIFERKKNKKELILFLMETGTHSDLF
jgi:mRNA-degrading endonuclease YafQ of YafQ-DinJ toxin-antitoxin module